MKENGSFLVLLLVTIASGVVIGLMAFGATGGNAGATVAGAPVTANSTVASTSAAPSSSTSSESSDSDASDTPPPSDYGGSRDKPQAPGDIEVLN